MADTLAIDYTAVYNAWRRFRKGKRPSRAIDEFAYNLEENISCLAEDLSAGNYQHGPYRAVILQEKKRRDLAVAGVRDRVVHRLLYDHLLEVWDARFDHDVWSCRVGKGLHACLCRTQQLLAKHSRSYIWRADIQKFFDSMDHAKLKQLLRRRSADPVLLGLLDKVIDSYETESVSQSLVYRLATSPAKCLRIFTLTNLTAMFATS